MGAPDTAVTVRDDERGKAAAPVANTSAKQSGGKPAKANGDKAMSILGHLGEIRKRLVSIAIVYLLLAIVCFLFVEYIVSALLKLGEGFSFIYMAPAELVSNYFRLSLILALVLASPFIIYHIWAFVSPALSKSEKRAGVYGLAGGLVFFMIGAVFAYLVAIPFMLDFFASYGTPEISPSISFEKYMDFLISTTVVFGVVFEMPVLSLLLTKFGILKPDFMVKSRKYAVLIVFILAAIITPPDVVSQVMIAFPMLLLYEVSIWVCKAVAKNRADKEASEEKGC